MEAFVFFILRESLLMTVFGEVKFATHNRFHALVLCRFRHKLKDAKHIAVVGNGNRRHPVGLGFGEHGRNIGCPVQKGILRVAMKMREFHI